MQDNEALLKTFSNEDTFGERIVASSRDQRTCTVQLYRRVRLHGDVHDDHARERCIRQHRRVEREGSGSWFRGVRIGRRGKRGRLSPLRRAEGQEQNTDDPHQRQKKHGIGHMALGARGGLEASWGPSSMWLVAVWHSLMFPITQGVDLHNSRPLYSSLF